MCGICGVCNYGMGEPVAQDIVASMTACLLHRGPDDEGFHFDREVGLGMRRLSIIDLAGGAQPISNETGSVTTVFNGEIYNFQELTRDLESHGHAFKTRSDTEVLVHAYEQWGIDFLARLNGMFGLAVWDSERRRLVLARDPFGVKPLYYGDDGRSLIFGSEIRSICAHPSVQRSVDPVALDQYLALSFVPSPRTMFEGIRKLAPGHALVCSASGPTDYRYHRVIPETSGGDERELVEQVRSAIEQAVRRQMVADVPVGALLSGGVDSSTVATLMSRLTDVPVDTFTVGFSGDFARNELEPARAVAAHLGTRHHEVEISAAGFAEFLPTSIWHLEEPISTSSTLPYYKLCELARQHVKVVLTGQGADEPFAGYPRYVGERYGSLYRALPQTLRQVALAPAIEALPRAHRMKRAVRSLGLEEPLERITKIYTLVHAPLRERLYRETVPAARSLEAVAAWQSEVAHLDPLSQMLYVDARLSLPDNLLIYGDKLSMAVSLEARVPFLDLELMRLVESIPPGMKIRGRTTKHILKRAVREWLPSGVLARPKIAFETPVDGWFQDQLRGELEGRLLAPGAACGIYFEPKVLREIISDHRRRREDYSRLLFSLLTFEIWHELYIEPSSLAKPRPRPALVAV
jgi:asparagine synthase (glutamine-hydrolysing)